MNARVDKLTRDASVWTHLGADTALRMKAVGKLKSAKVTDISTIS
jgi:hypothetical protein